MWINQREVGIIILLVTVLRYDTLTVFYPGCMTTWTTRMCPFAWRNPRLRTLFHVRWGDDLFLKLHFVWVLRFGQLWRVVQPCFASATLRLMYTKLRALDTSIIRLIGCLYNTNKGTGISPNFIDTASSLPRSQQLTTFPSPEIEKSSSLHPISYIILIYVYFFQIVSFLQIFLPKIRMKFSSPLLAMCS